MLRPFILLICRLQIPQQTTPSFALAKQEGRVVITKDSDFVDSKLLRNEPEKLLFITTGNIENDDLIRLIRGHWPQILAMLQQGSYVEVSRSALTLHY